MELQTSEQTINAMRRCIKDSSRIVAVLGIEMMVECGGKDFESNDEICRIEQQYGYCPEELLSGALFCAKKEKFYKFYTNEILTITAKPTPAFESLFKLQQQGKLDTVINLNYHPVPELYHFNKVINLNGNLHHNHCHKCQRDYDVDYIVHSSGIPQCEVCKSALRPDIRLIGERVDNQLMTKALEACDNADVLLIMGKNIFEDSLQSDSPDIIKRHQVKILFTKERYLPEERADYIIHDEIQQIMPLLVL